MPLSVFEALWLDAVCELAVCGMTVLLMPNHACTYTSFASFKVEEGAAELTRH